MAAKLPNIPDNTDDLLYVKRVIKGKDKYCGYKMDYLAKNLTEMEEGFVVCKVCSGLMRDASLYNGETTCVFCSQVPDRLNAVNIVQDSVAQFEIKCPILRNCNWKGKLSEAEKHLEVCSDFRIECAECKLMFPRKEKNRHKSELCPMRVIKCPYWCFKFGYVKDLEKHKQLCVKFPILCQNGCGVELAREDHFKHRSVCELEEIACPYAEYGCDANPMLRRDLLTHKKENIVEHTDMSLSKIKKLEKEKDQIEWKIMTMKQLDGVEWEIKNPEKLALGQILEGPTFFVNSFKLIVCVIFEKDTSTFRRDCLYFFIKRIEGKSDKQLGMAYITHFRVIIVDKQDYAKSHYKDGSMNHRLKIGDNSEILYTEYINKKYLTADKSLLFRFYFDINTQPPLRKIEDKSCTANIELSPNPPSVDCDPFDHLVYEPEPEELLYTSIKRNSIFF